MDIKIWANDNATRGEYRCHSQGQASLIRQKQAIEQKWYEYWIEHNYFHSSLLKAPNSSLHEDNPNYIYLIGSTSKNTE